MSSLCRPSSSTELTWLSYLSDHATFREVHERFGHLGVSECARQFRTLYRGSAAYSDGEVRTRFEELQAETDDEAEHKQHHNTSPIRAQIDLVDDSDHDDADEVNLKEQVSATSSARAASQSACSMYEAKYDDAVE